MDYQYIKVEKKGHLTTITINRPEVMNALHPPAHHELSRAFDEYTADPSAWVAIITSAGDRAFCSGNDLKYQMQHGREVLEREMRGLKGGFAGITARFDCYKPIIAAVNGVAAGGGTEIALACDIIISAETAIFGLPEPKVGLFSGAGGIHRLARQIPYHIAMGLALTGRLIGAHEAKQIGMVNEVVPPADLMPTAERWAGEIIDNSPLSVRGTKRMILEGLDGTLEQAVTRNYPVAEEILKSEDMLEGIRAFTEKRKPQWKGK
ncbi:MAG TPA: enoyl-CoA hydratase-related protein [Deltaproteobacteria bacterium]|nr:enoyl-CoA hydratase-related protein [Deltaproteobacteria bacterium]